MSYTFVKLEPNNDYYNSTEQCEQSMKLVQPNGDVALSGTFSGTTVEGEIGWNLVKAKVVKASGKIDYAELTVDGRVLDRILDRMTRPFYSTQLLMLFFTACMFIVVLLLEVPEEDKFRNWAVLLICAFGLLTGYEIREIMNMR